MLGTRLSVQDSGCKIQDAGCWILDESCHSAGIFPPFGHRKPREDLFEMTYMIQDARYWLLDT